MPYRSLLLSPGRLCAPCSRGPLIVSGTLLVVTAGERLEAWDAVHQPTRCRVTPTTKVYPAPRVHCAELTDWPWEVYCSPKQSERRAFLPPWHLGVHGAHLEPAAEEVSALGIYGGSLTSFHFALVPQNSKPSNSVRLWVRRQPFPSFFGGLDIWQKVTWVLDSSDPNLCCTPSDKEILLTYRARSLTSLGRRRGSHGEKNRPTQFQYTALHHRSVIIQTPFPLFMWLQMWTGLL